MRFYLVLLTTCIGRGLATPSFYPSNKAGGSLTNSFQAVNDNVKKSVSAETSHDSTKKPQRAFPKQYVNTTHTTYPYNNINDAELRPVVQLLVYQLQTLRKMCETSEDHVKQLIDQVREDFTTQLRQEVQVLNVEVQKIRRKSVEDRYNHLGRTKEPCGSGCPASFLPVGDECFYVHHHSPLPWHDAREYCQQQLGGDLAVPDDVLSLRQFLLQYGHTKNFWLGASDEFVEGDFRWLDGHQLDWKTGWPPGRGPSGGNEDENCVHFGPAYDMYLNVANCRHAKHFICESQMLPSGK